MTCYTGIDFIENPYYDISNNISSLYVAREYLDDCIILDGDQMIYNPEVLSPYFEHSGYNSVWTEEYTKEWLQEVKEGRVVSCSQVGKMDGSFIVFLVGHLQMLKGCDHMWR